MVEAVTGFIYSFALTQGSKVKLRVCLHNMGGVDGVAARRRDTSTRVESAAVNSKDPRWFPMEGQRPFLRSTLRQHHEVHRADQSGIESAAQPQALLAQVFAGFAPPPFFSFPSFTPSFSAIPSSPFQLEISISR